MKNDGRDDVDDEHRLSSFVFFARFDSIFLFPFRRGFDDSRDSDGAKRIVDDAGRTTRRFNVRPEIVDL